MISFEANYGDAIRQVQISQILGAGDTWHVYINKVEVAKIYKRHDGYYYEENDLQVDDIQAILDRIMDYLNVPYQPVIFHYYCVYSGQYKQKIKPLIS